MQKTIVALYDDVHDTERAVRDLIDTGISRDQISLMANHASGEVEDIRTDVDETSGAAEGAGVGAGIGAALGGIGGLLVGLGALVIPGVGPVLAAGPLAAAIGGIAGAGAGAVAGGAAGGLIGALADMGVNEEQAGYYAEGVRRGGTLLTVRTDETLAPRAVEVMNRHHPIDVRQRAAEWRESGWTKFDPNSGPYDSGSVRGAGSSTSSFGSTGTSTTDFSARSEMDRPGSVQSSATDYDSSRVIDPRTDTGVSGQGTGYSGGMGVSSISSPGAGFVTQSFDVYEAEFRNDYNDNFANRGFSYNQYQPAYRYGYDLATDERYRGRDWVDVEADARQDWDALHPDSPWENFKYAVRNAWERVHNALR